MTVDGSQQRRISPVERPTRRAALALLAFGVALQGCDGSVAGGYRDDPARVPQQVSDTDRQAAAALSLTTATSAQRGDDPYATALGCAAAIGVLQAVAQDNRLLGSREREGIQSARAEYTSRTVRLAGQRDLTQEQASAEIEQAQAAAAYDPGNAARNALACISDLARGN